MRPIVIAIVVAAAVSAIAGCSTESDSATPSTSAAAASAAAASFCESYCQKINECDSSNDVQTCTETCDDSVTSTLEKLRPEITSEVGVKYSVISLTAINKVDLTKPKVDLTLKLSANKDRFGLSVAAHLKDDNVTGSASASYKIAESLKLGVDLSRKNRADMGNRTENLIMFELRGTFP